VTGDPLKAFVLGLKMIALVLSFRLKAPRRLPRAEALDVETAEIRGVR
jgi:hypothetical protein